MHFPDLEVCCDWSTLFPLKSADAREAGTRDEPLKNVCVGGYEGNDNGNLVPRVLSYPSLLSEKEREPGNEVATTVKKRVGQNQHTFFGTFSW